MKKDNLDFPMFNLKYGDAVEYQGKIIKNSFFLGLKDDSQQEYHFSWFEKKPWGVVLSSITHPYDKTLTKISLTKSDIKRVIDFSKNSSEKKLNLPDDNINVLKKSDAKYDFMFMKSSAKAVYLSKKDIGELEKIHRTLKESRLMDCLSGVDSFLKEIIKK